MLICLLIGTAALLVLGTIQAIVESFIDRHPRVQDFIRYWFMPTCWYDHSGSLFQGLVMVVNILVLLAGLIIWLIRR